MSYSRGTNRFKSMAHELGHLFSLLFVMFDHKNQTKQLAPENDYRNYTAILKEKSIQIIDKHALVGDTRTAFVPQRFKNTLAFGGACALLTKEADLFSVITGANINPAISKGFMSGADLLMYKNSDGLDSFDRAALTATFLIAKTDHFFDLTNAFIDLSKVSHNDLTEVINLDEVSSEKTLHKYLHQARLLLAKNKITG